MYYKIKLKENKVEVLGIVKEKEADGKGIMFVTLDELSNFSNVDMTKLRIPK